MQKVKKFPEEITRFYGAQIILLAEYLMSVNKYPIIIPEHLLLSDGYLLYSPNFSGESIPVEYLGNEYFQLEKFLNLKNLRKIVNFRFFKFLLLSVQLDLLSFST